MPTRETCLVCKAPLQWIPPAREEMGGFYLHVFNPPGYKPHPATPAVENPAVASEARPAEDVSPIPIEEIRLTYTPAGERWLCSCGFECKFRTFAIAHMEMVRAIALTVDPTRRWSARVVHFDDGNRMAVMLKQG